jgi:phage terminase large subunit-like protein
MVCRVMRNHRILWRDAHRAPLGGGLVKAEWFKRYRENERPERFDRIVQSWDTANKQPSSATSRCAQRGE